MTIETTNLNANAQDTALKAMFEQQMIKYGNDLSRYKELGFADVDARTIDQDVYTSMGGMEDAELTAEKQKYAETNLIEGFKVTPILQKWTQSIGISEEMERFDITEGKKVVKSVKDAAKSVIRRINKNAADIYNKGFDTSYATGGDTKALFATDHPLEDLSGKTNSNIVAATHLPLSVDAHGKAYLKMLRFQDGRGDETTVDPGTMILSPENVPEALKIFNSTQAPDTANNDTNVYTKYGRMNIVSNKHIGRGENAAIGEGKWFLVDTDLAKEFLMMSWAWKPRVANDSEVSNGTKTYNASAMFAPFFSDWRFAIGSKGDGSAA